MSTKTNVITNYIPNSIQFIKYIIDNNIQNSLSYEHQATYNEVNYFIQSKKNQYILLILHQSDDDNYITKYESKNEFYKYIINFNYLTLKISNEFDSLETLYSFLDTDIKRLFQV
jgi:hypothetical protein